MKQCSTLRILQKEMQKPNQWPSSIWPSWCWVYSLASHWWSFCLCHCNQLMLRPCSYCSTLGITLEGDAADADAANGKSYLLSTCVAVVALLLHSFLKCPMFWHLWQTASPHWAGSPQVSGITTKPILREFSFSDRDRLFPFQLWWIYWLGYDGCSWTENGTLRV